MIFQREHLGDSLRVAVVDMQPITPAVGGGRLRLLGLYHGLGSQFSTSYVGTYDWPGERCRELRLSESLVEIDVPLSAEHFRLDAQWGGFAGGATVIDTAFPILGRLSGEFLERARNVIANCDVVVFSHPWVYPLLAQHVDRSQQLLIYDAQNVEGVLRCDILGEAAFNREIAKGVAMAELFLAREADMVIGCSEEDVAFFQDTYGVNKERLFVVPNGVFVNAITPVDAARKSFNKDMVGLSGPVALFLGSNYGPNVEAAGFICRTLAPSLPEITFLVCGGVGEVPSLRAKLPGNVRVTGTVSDEEKLRYLHATDVALNPMFSGSGTNIKIFDFMAAGLPVVTTHIGARGITTETEAGVIVCDPSAIVEELTRVLEDTEYRHHGGLENRRWVEQEFAWEVLSPGLGKLIAQGVRTKSAACGIAGDSALRRAEADRDKCETKVAFSGEARVNLAILSTLGIRCGIAEYTSYLSEALLDVGANITFIANLLEGHEAATVVLPAALRRAHVERIWRYDNVKWSQSRVEGDEVLEIIRSNSITHLNVQYHRGFYPEHMLIRLVRIVAAVGVKVSVTLHNSSDAAAAFLDQLARLPATVIVHKDSEQWRLRQIGFGEVVYIPQGIRRLSAVPHQFPPFLRQGAGPLLGTFGFLRPHKGLYELVDAMYILSGIFPGIRLLAQTALYPSKDSAEYLARVQGRIDELGLRESVHLDTNFLDIDRAISGLSEVDVVVLPYAASDEGASAAAATALAARRPLIATKARIFEEMKSIAYLAEDNSPPVLAAAIGSVFSNAALRRHLQGQSCRVAEEREWRNIASRFMQLAVGADKLTELRCTGATSQSPVPIPLVS